MMGLIYPNRNSSHLSKRRLFFLRGFPQNLLNDLNHKSPSCECPPSVSRELGMEWMSICELTHPRERERAEGTLENGRLPLCCRRHGDNDSGGGNRVRNPACNALTPLKLVRFGTPESAGAADMSLVSPRLDFYLKATAQPPAVSKYIQYGLQSGEKVLRGCEKFLPALA